MKQFFKDVGTLLPGGTGSPSKLNYYKLIPYPMDNCFTRRRDRSHQTTEKQSVTDMNRSHIELVQTLASDKISQAIEKIWSGVTGCILTHK